MSAKCDRFQQLMLDGLNAKLSADERRAVEQHVTDCAACRAYGRALEADDRLLSGYAETLRPTVTRVENAVVEALGREESPVRSRGTQCRRGRRVQRWRPRR